MKKIIIVLLFTTSLFAQTYTLTVNTDGNGSVALNPAGGVYNAGDVVTLTVTPNTGYVFNYWDGGGSDDWNDSMLPKKIPMDENKTITANFMEDMRAFPGAEGGGAYTVGGRGGAVIEVTNLNSEGAGSFREACLTPGARTIVFRVGGTIDLDNKKILVSGSAYDNLTIAGQTAPGGIQIKKGTLNLEINQAIVRYIRFRTGPFDGDSPSSVDPNRKNPSNLTIGAPERRDRRRNIIFDHISAFWGVNKTIVLGGFVDNLTIQWSIIAEGLHRTVYEGPESWEPYYYDFDGDGVDGGPYWEHSRGLMTQEISRNISTHHNLLYNFYKRNPLIQSSDADVVNNVMVNKQYQTFVQPFKGEVRANFVGNYYRSYAHVRPPIRFWDYNNGWDSLSACYYHDNYDQHFRPNNTDPETNIRVLHTKDDTGNDGHISDRATPFVFNYTAIGDPITTQDVHDAYSLVLNNAGAKLPTRDAADVRVIDAVLGGSAPSSFVNHPDDVGGWPTIVGDTAPVDSDHDGMPDSWETEKGLNPNDASDRNGTNLSSEGYTNLEVYINDIADAPLPVELVLFTVKKEKDITILNWETATEINNYGFEIEASSNTGYDGFGKIGFVEGHGNSNSPKNYRFATKKEAKYYRLKQIDVDGSFEYSNVVTVKGALAKTALYQNHPNPFNPSTQIRFSLSAVSNVNISVYNVLGQKVAELVNGKMDAGNHSINFNASELTSGIYIYKIETPNYTKSMKMLLVK